MEKKWNLQDIKPAERRKTAPKPAARRPEPEKAERAAEPLRRQPIQSAHKPSGAKRSRKGIWAGVLIVVLVAAAGIAVSSLTAGATVTVYPKFREPTVNAIVEGRRQAGGSELAFEVMTLEAEGEREVAATGQEEVETQATGRVTIYNTGSDSQRLITNTRFESGDGLIFRIKDPAVVPPATAEGPGSIAAEVFADEAGSQYNLPAGTRFTVPGFRENNLTELYESVYAENHAAFSGGHIGPRFIIDDAELSAATDSLRTELRQALMGRVAGERPAGFVLFDSAIVFSYENLDPEDLGGGRVKIGEKAILHVPMFRNEDLAAFVGASTIPGFEGEPVRMEDPSVLSFEYASPYDPGDPEVVSFKLLGKPRLIWTYDGERLKQDLAGGAQTALNTVLGGYPAIERATANIRPFWKQSFPDNPSEITIREVVGSDS